MSESPDPPVISPVSVASCGVSGILDQPAEPLVVSQDNLAPVISVHITFISVEISGNNDVLKETDGKKREVTFKVEETIKDAERK